MDAGTADGVTAGAEFAVYKEGYLSQEASPLGTLIAKEPREFTTTMFVPEGSREWSVPKGWKAFALQTKAGDKETLHIHIAKDENLIGDLVKHVEAKGGKIKHVDEEHKAHLSITVDGARVFFDILDNGVTPHGLKRMPNWVNKDVNEVHTVIRAAAHYQWHLHRTNKENPPPTNGEKPLRDQVDIKFMELDESNYTREPVGDNLIVKRVVYPVVNRDVDPVFDRVVDLVVDEETVYGVEITNNSENPLYAALFFFSSSDFAISE